MGRKKAAALAPATDRKVFPVSRKEVRDSIAPHGGVDGIVARLSIPINLTIAAVQAQGVNTSGVQDLLNAIVALAKREINDESGETTSILFRRGSHTFEVEIK